MTRRAWCAVVVVAVTVGLCVPEPADASTPSPGDQAGAGTAVMRAVAYVQAVDAAQLTQIEHAVDELLDQVAVFVAAVTPPPPPPNSSASSAPVRNSSASSAPVGTGGGGALSYDRLRALSQCESGGVNGWRTGYFGIEAGYPIGNLSWDEQAAWANRIYAQHGASAWGCPV